MYYQKKDLACPSKVIYLVFLTTFAQLLMGVLEQDVSTVVSTEPHPAQAHQCQAKVCASTAQAEIIGDALDT